MRVIGVLLLSLLAMQAQDVREGVWRGRQIRYLTGDRGPLLEGDIRLEQIESKSRGAAVSGDESRRWPGGVVPYVVAAGMPEEWRLRVASAIASVNEWGVVRLAERTNEANWVSFVPGTGCSSFVGMIGGTQEITVAEPCDAPTNVHEILHALGLYHEQSRTDRNAFVQVIPGHIDKRALINFEQETAVRDLGWYDYGSVMHYRARDFNRHNRANIVTIPAGIPLRVNEVGASAGDIRAVRRLYGKITARTTVTTNPPGQIVNVDGVEIKTPESFDWAPGASHTVEVKTPQGEGNVRYVTGRWSDDSERTMSALREITAGGDDVVYSYNFVRHFALAAVVTAAGGGTVTVEPKSDDGFYADGALVTITASPAGGFNFLRWSGTGQFGAHGLSQNPVTIEVTESGYEYRANFTPGAVTTVTSSPAGLRLMVDGQEIITPRSYRWDPASSHTVEVGEEQRRQVFDGGTVRQIFTDWSDSGQAAHSITGAPSVLTAAFRTQYAVTARSANSTEAGSVTVEPAADDGFYDEGAVVKFLASPAEGLVLLGWTGDLSGTDLTGQVTVREQVLATAKFGVKQE